MRAKPTDRPLAGVALGLYECRPKRIPVDSRSGALHHRIGADDLVVARKTPGSSKSSWILLRSGDRLLDARPDLTLRAAWPGALPSLPPVETILGRRVLVAMRSESRTSYCHSQ